MKKTAFRVLMTAVLLTLAAGLATVAQADDAKWQDKQFHAGVKAMGKAYKELHKAHVDYLVYEPKNAEQAFRKALKHFSLAEEHLAKSEVTKKESKQIDEAVKHLNQGNKALESFVMDLDKGKSKDAEQKLAKAVEHYGKAMDMM